MNSDVEVDWNPPGPNAKPIKIETQRLSYHEAASQIWLNPWGRLTRENTVVEGNDVTVYLQDDDAGHKIIRKIETTHAHGTDDYPNRKLAYSADYLLVDFDDDGAVRKITGSTAARLVSTSEASETTVTADRVEMDFESQNKQSLLSHVTALGHGLVTSKPLPAPGRQLGETHTLRSENIEMKMRPGGREIETVVTHAPGVLEFLPNLPTDHHRTLNGNDLIHRLRPAKPHPIVPRPRRHHPDRTHRRGTQAQPHALRHHQPRFAGALRSPDEPPRVHGANRRFRLRRRRTPCPRRQGHARFRPERDCARDFRARVGRDRLHFGQPHPHGPAHRRLHRRGTSEFQPPPRPGPEEEFRRCSPATSRWRRRRARWIPPTTTAPSTTRATSPCARAPTAYRPASST